MHDLIFALTPNEEKWGTKNLQAHSGELALINRTPRLHLAAKEAFFCKLSLWKVYTDRSFAVESHLLEFDSSGTPFTTGPAIKQSHLWKSLTTRVFSNNNKT
jgi:hypothetical protein